jgi:serine/threonine protein kinase
MGDGSILLEIPAGYRLGAYVLEAEIGRGSMGIVYRGTQRSLNRQVAIKVLPRSVITDAAFATRFIREARLIAVLNHPNIVHIYDAGQSKDMLYFVMEYIQGPTVGQLLRRQQRIEPRRATEIAAQVADAMDYVYADQQIVHRDIKPENIMIDRWNQVKVMDFGLARTHTSAGLTMAGTVVGSLYYVSPEQLFNQPVDGRADIYSLGVTLYEMITGVRPFEGHSLVDITRAITSDPVIPPRALIPDLPEDLDAIILKAMARDARDRFARAGDMARALREVRWPPIPSLALLSDVPLSPPEPEPAMAPRARATMNELLQRLRRWRDQSRRPAV